MNEAEFNKFMSKARKEIKLKNYHNFKEWLSLFIKEIRVGEDDITVILSYKKIVTKLGGGDESRTRVRKPIHKNFYECIPLFAFPRCNVNGRTLQLGSL